MDELKNIIINEEGIFCHYYPVLHREEPISVPISYRKINVYLYSHDAGYLGWMDKGNIWCKKFQYKHFEKTFGLNVYI